jgi:hypothetical protein
MPQRRAALLSSNEADIQLALSSLKTNQIQSNRRAAIAFNVPQTMLNDQHAEKPAQRDC